MKTWQERLRHEIGARGFTQDEFAYECGKKSQGWLSKKLGGKRKPTLEEFEEWATVLTKRDPEHPVYPSYLAFGLPSDEEIIRAQLRRIEEQKRHAQTNAAGVTFDSQSSHAKRAGNYVEKDRKGVSKAKQSIRQRTK